MSRLDDRFDCMSLDDFEELLPEKPRDETRELIGGRVVRMMTGARWEHHFIVQNINFALSRHLRGSGSTCHVFTESFRLKEDAIDSSLLPDVIVCCGPMAPGATSLNDPTVLVDATLDLATLDLSIPLAEIYRDVLKP